MNLGSPTMKKIIIKKNLQKKYKKNTPASHRQIFLFNKLTRSNIETTPLTFFEMSDVIAQINVERGYDIGDAWKTRVSVMNYMRNRSQEVIDQLMYLIKHATIYEHPNGVRYASIGETPAISCFHYDSMDRRAKRFLREFEINYWKYLLYINYRFNWRYRNTLNMMGISLMYVLQKDRSIQNLIYNMVVDYANLMKGTYGISVTTIIEE